MSQPIPDSALRLVEACFGAAVLRGAVESARGGRVHLVKPPPWPVVARVRGEAGYLVTVEYQPGSRHLRGECSCPARADCEHVAAAALVALAEERERAAGAAEATRQALVGAWLAELGRQEARPEPAPATHAVAYLLDARDGEPAITVLQCSRLEGGELGAAAVLGALSDPQRGAPRWVEADDLRRIALLRAVTRAAPQVTRLPLGRVHGELLRDLAGSGRLFWGSTRSAPLGYGPAARDTLRWQPAPEAPGAHRLGLDPGRLLLPAREPHYLDPASATLGPLELGLPGELVQRLVAGPPVPASMRATVERSLGPLLAPAGPASPEPLRPRLLASLEQGEGRVPVVRVSGEAAYGEDRFPLAEWDPARPAARDLVGEGRHQARLQTLLERLPHGERAHSSLELLADARYVAEVLVPALRAEGWACVLSDDFPVEAPREELEWVERLRPLDEEHGWFALELGVRIEGRTVPLLPLLLQAIREGRLSLETGGALRVGAGLNLRLPEGELIHVPTERVQRWLGPLVELALADRLRPSGELALPGLVAAALAAGEGRAPVELGAAREHLEGLLELAPRQEGGGFRGELRPYQRLGLAWLQHLHQAGWGGLLADEMGLGKTVQVLAFLDGLRAARQLGPAAPALIVAPRSVVGNWAAEAARFTPRLKAAIHLGPSRARDAGALARAPLLITSYQTLLRDLPLLRGVAWRSVVFDEAQALKNPATRLRAAAAALRAQSRFCLTGTPVENHLGELWSELDLALPGLLGRRRTFEAVFRRAIERDGDAERLELLRRRVRPFLLRRTKAAVEPDLPPKTEVVERVELDSPQRDLYESLRLKLDARVQKALAQQDVQAGSIAILEALLRLRQVCCDPRLLPLPEARKAGSAKLERLLGMLGELAQSGRAALVFSQFTSMLALIERACAEAGLPTLTLTGETRDREAVVRRFQAGEAPIFLISLKAGGTGLNLTRADTVIHYDPWWNPAAEAQATDRAHRLGQDKSVLVYKLVARGTLEEAICQLQAEKQQLSRATLHAGGVTHLGPEDLQALYRLVV